MTNGLRFNVGETRVFDGFASDIIGVELQMSFILANEPDLARYRSLARRKPVLTLTYQGWPDGVFAWDDEADVATLWRYALLYGFAPASGCGTLDQLASPGPVTDPVGMSEIEIRYQDRYLPVLRSLLAAGWEPITGIRSADGPVRVERYGDGDAFYLVVYNIGADISTSFAVDDTVIPGVHSDQVFDVLTGEPATADERNALRGDSALNLASQELRVFSFGR